MSSSAFSFFRSPCGFRCVQEIRAYTIVHTPKHGRWLNIAERELSALETQCLDERIGNETVLRKQVTAWSGQRNTRFKKIDWQFTSTEARIKLRHLYPQLW
jgi:hypothetical protein